jgi:ParB family chromosome partitioning protein
MKRKELVSALLASGPRAEAGDAVDQKPQRVAAGAVRAMGLELNRLAERADEAQELRQQLETGAVVVELDPETLEPSFISDRLAPTDDPQYRQLVETIRKDGQQLPILVRPHPVKSGSYQIAYGHRRWHAARELAIKVRAIVQSLSDAQLVVAQGKENSERRNLSFIERALFAAKLDAGGFDRATINSALAVQSAEVSRFLAVATAIPAKIVTLIGPAPKAGRTRWMELADHLQAKEAEQIAYQNLESPPLKRLGTDARFEALMECLRAASLDRKLTDHVTNVRGETVVKVDRSGRGVKLSIDGRFTAGFGEYLIHALPELLKRFEDETDRPSDGSISDQSDGKDQPPPAPTPRTPPAPVTS